MDFLSASAGDKKGKSKKSKIAQGHRKQERPKKIFIGFLSELSGPAREQKRKSYSRGDAGTQRKRKI